MIKNTYLFSKCSICGEQQNSSFNKIYNYCIDCKIIICDKCLNKHVVDNEEHKTLKNNEVNLKCLIHKKDIFGCCLDCNQQICEKCLEDLAHFMHKKNII